MGKPQQIAGIPTAISELFKNAHDAYADRVEVDFYRADGLFVLRDDGLGMTREDFEQRWLTLGTESKLAAMGGLAPPPVDVAKPRRPVLGEKGIGRLAIAAIGPLVLVLTRAKPAVGGSSDLIAALIHWGLFQIPGVDLDEIEIPVKKFKGGTLPDAQEVAALVEAVRKNTELLSKRADKEMRSRIAREIKQFKVDPVSLDESAGVLSLAGEGHGTQFYIQPTDESMIPAIEGKADDDIAPPLIKTLIGFTNTMTPEHSMPAIQAAFRDHKTEDLADDLIGDGEFFTPYEFKNADHHIEGRFDEFGQFLGTVTVYGEPTTQHVVPWTAAMGRTTDCGPFRITVAVVQGLPNQTTLPSEDWVAIIRKLTRIGGLYIYRDGIRILPYGNNDYDFLNIERNRSKSASDNYFSYRRIFGVIEIDHEHNGSLVEKAGREGFRENKAYRQFQAILENFFHQIAFDFFREGGVHAERYYTRKTEIDRLERARKAREKQVAVRRSAFRSKLDEVLAAFRNGTPAQESIAILRTLEGDLKVAATLKDHDRAVVAFLEAEAAARGALGAARTRYRVVAPRGVGLPKKVRRDYDVYRDQYDKVIPVTFGAAQARAEELLRLTAERTQIAVDRRVRFERALNDLTIDVRRAAQSETQQTRTAAEEVLDRVTALARDSLADVDRVVNDVLSQAARLDVGSLDDAAFVNERTRLEEVVQKIAEDERGLLNGVAEQLRRIAWTSPDDDTADVREIDMTEALEEEVIELRERSEADLELAQLGMAIQVINHEFDHTIKSIRVSIRKLQAWADANESLRDVYSNIRRNFDHLDGYLTLFTPLQRRLYRAKVTFSGGEIFKFLTDLFQERLERARVSLTATSAFKKHSITGYPSTFYPVFVNVIDNALFWLERSPEPRHIQLDARKPAMFISNSGLAISEHDREEIFMQGFTRKPGGRGLGLHIARQVLNRERFTIRVVDPMPGMGVTFVMEPCGHDGEEPA